MAKKRKPSPQMPESCLEVWARGERVRFNGGWLDSTEEDRAVAEWIDENPRKAWTKMKLILYLYINKKFAVATHDGSHQVITDDNLGDAADALANMEF